MLVLVLVVVVAVREETNEKTHSIE